MTVPINVYSPRLHFALSRPGMTSRPNFVVVDDTSTTQPEQIKYSTGWTAQRFQDNVGSTGSPLYQSLHVATSSATFTFTYNGAAGPLFVMGSILSNSVPVWSCTLDNKPMISISNGQSTLPSGSNHIPLCSFDSQTTPIGDHTIRVSVAASESSPAYFDYILYTPASIIRPGDLFFESSNSGLQYGGSGWHTDGSNGIATSNPGDTLDFVFNGHTVSCVGFLDGAQGKEPADATYSIDGASPIDFTITNTASGSTVLTEQLFFQTASQGPGRHHLQVVYHGAVGSTPLTLDHLIIQNSTTDIELTPVPALTTIAQGGISQPTLFSSSQAVQPTPFPFSSVRGAQPTFSSGAQAATFSTKLPATTTLMFLPSVGHTPTSGVHGSPSHNAKVAGICIGVLVVLCLIIVCGFRARRARSKASRSSSELVQPFPDRNRPPPVPEKGQQQQQSADIFQADVEGQSPVTISASSRPSKARRLAEITASALRRSSRSRRTQGLSELSEVVTGTNDRTVRMIIHQDSGVPLRQPDEEVIEIPPAYASIS